MQVNNCNTFWNWDNINTLCICNVLLSVILSLHCIVRFYFTRIFAFYASVGKFHLLIYFDKIFEYLIDVSHGNKAQVCSNQQ